MTWTDICEQNYYDQKCEKKSILINFIFQYFTVISGFYTPYIGSATSQMWAFKHHSPFKLSLKLTFCRSLG